MRQQVQRHFGFLWTTLLGGVVFLLPLAVVLWLIGYAGYAIYSAVVSIQTFLKSEQGEALADYTDLGLLAYGSLFVATLVLLAGVCFVAGMLARRSLGRWFSRRAERYLLMLFPRYAVFKDQLTGNLGSAKLRPVLARIGPATQIGMEVERTDAGLVTVYLPSSPDPWSGTVRVVPAADITAIEGEFVDVMATFEQLGRGTGAFVEQTAAASADPS